MYIDVTEMINMCNSISVPNNVSIIIENGDFLSLNEIKRLKTSGTSILRSAHIGNLNSQTLFLAKEGFSIILDEYARGSMRVYKPAFEISRSGEIDLTSQKEIPATHSYFYDNKTNNYCNLATYHYRSLTKLFPNSIILTSTHLLKHKKFIYRAFELLVNKRPQSFSRVIDTNGKIFKFFKVENDMIYFCSTDKDYLKYKLSEIPNLTISGIEETEKIVKFNKLPSLPIITLDVDVDISLLTLCDIKWENFSPKSNKVLAVHFSGLEMINYMIKNTAEAKYHTSEINEIINLIISIWTKNPPKEIRMLIVSTDLLPYFICDNKKDEMILNDFFLSNKKIEELNKKKSLNWKNNKDKATKTVENMTYSELVELINNIVYTNNMPSSFINQLKKTKIQLLKKTELERKKLDKLVINYILYNKIIDESLNEINKKISHEIESIKNMHIKVTILTQYDLLNNEKLYFPSLAYTRSFQELRADRRKINKNDTFQKNREFCKKILSSPRLNELLEHFENISNGSEQVPLSLPKTNQSYLKTIDDFQKHEIIFSKNLGQFFKHGIASIPYLSEEILRVDHALISFARSKKITQNNPLTYWETSSADGTRARTLAEYSNGTFITITDSPNIGNMKEFQRLITHGYSFFHLGPFTDINWNYLDSQKFNSAFKDGFDVI